MADHGGDDRHGERERCDPEEQRVRLRCLADVTRSVVAASFSGEVSPEPYDGGRDEHDDLQHGHCDHAAERRPPSLSLRLCRRHRCVTHSAFVTT